MCYDSLDGKSSLRMRLQKPILTLNGTRP